MAQMKIPDEIYNDLSDLKRGDESFGSVIKYLINFYKNNKDKHGVRLDFPKEGRDEA